MAPALEHMQLRAFAHADRARVGPSVKPVRSQRGQQAGVVRTRRLRADACALAQADLRGKTGLAWCELFQAEQALAQAMLFGQLAQGSLGGTLALEEAVQRTFLAGQGGMRRDQRSLQRLPRRVLQVPSAIGTAGAQAPVVCGPQLLDQLGFEQQGAELAMGGAPLDAPHLLRQIHFLGRTVVGGEMRKHTLLQVQALADVQRQAVFAVKKIHAVALRQIIDQRRIQMAGQTRARAQCLYCRFDRGRRMLVMQLAPELMDQARVAQGAMALRHVQAVAQDQGIQVVPRMLRIKAARELHGTQHGRAKVDAQAFELSLEKTVVKTRVVRNEQPALQTREQILCNLGKTRRVGHHLVADACEVDDEVADARLRIHQAAPFAHACL